MCEKKIQLISALLFLLPFVSQSANRYWVATTISNWNSTSNWSTLSGGAGGASVPTTTDVAIFDNNGLFNCFVDVIVDIGGLTINGYTGIIDISGYSFTTVGTVTLATGTINDTPGTGSFIVNSGTTCTFSGTTFGADVNASSTNIYLNGSTFNGEGSFTKTGGWINSSTGGNTFNGAASIVSEADAGNIFSLGETNPDIFNGDLTISNFSVGEDILMAYTSSGNQYNGNIILNSTSTGEINFGQNGGDATLADTKTVSIGGSGYSAGKLRFKNFTQLGNTAQSLTFTGSANIYFETGAIWNGGLTISSPNIYLNGSIFNGVVSFTKVGGGNNSCQGGNTFNGATTIVSGASAGGNLILENTNPDIFNGDLTISNFSASEIIYVSYASSGNQFNGNIILNSTSSSGEINFGNTGGDATLADTKTVSIGGSGFSSGSLRFKNFTQLGNAAQSLTLTGSAVIYFQTGSTFNGSVTVAAPHLYLNGSTFNNVSSFTKTIAIPSGGHNYSDGGNVFNAATSITQNGLTNIFFANSSNPDIFNGDLTLTSSSSNLSVAYNASGNQFNGNLILNCTGGSIRFSTGTGSCILADTKIIMVGGIGVSAGSVIFQNFVQAGNTPQVFTFTGTASLSFGIGTEFNADLTVSTPLLKLDGATFNGTSSLTKTDGAGEGSQGAGGNTFNGVTTITNASSKYLRLSNTAGFPDDFNNDVTFVRSGTGSLTVSRLNMSTFSGDVNINGSSIINFGTSAVGRGALFDGSGSQSINDALGASATPNIYSLEVNNTMGALTLNMPVDISTALSLTNGNIITTTTNLLTMNDDATVNGSSNDSYVKGPIKKIGDDAFTFPVGDGGYYRPISISAPSLASHAFRAEYLYQNSYPTYDSSSLDGTIEHISRREYWILDRTNGTSDVDVTLTWDTNSGGVTELSELLVARWDGATWKDHGNGGTTGDLSSGSVVTSAAVTSFSPFTLGSTTVNNPLPVNLVSFKAVPDNGNVVNLYWTTAAEKDNNFFTVERSKDARAWEEILEIRGAGNSIKKIDYFAIDYAPIEGCCYYRLKQTNFNGKFSYSFIVSVEFKVYAKASINLFPNPVKEQNITVNLIGMKEKQVLVVLRDHSGKKIYSKSLIVDTENELTVIDINNRLSAGYYLLTVTCNEMLYSKKLVVIN